MVKTTLVKYSKYKSPINHVSHTEDSWSLTCSFLKSNATERNSYKWTFETVHSIHCINSVSLALFPFKWKVIYFRVDPLEVRNDFTFLLKAPKCLVLDTSTFNFQHNTIKRQCDLILQWKVTAGQMADSDKVLDFFSELQCCCVFGAISRKIIRNDGFCFEQEISRKRHERQKQSRLKTAENSEFDERSQTFCWSFSR